MTAAAAALPERFGTAKRVAGALLVLAGPYILYSNEGREVARSRALIDGREAVTVAAGRADPAHDGMLVHVAGPLDVPGALTDEAFGVSVPGAVQMHRTVEMYQWRETKFGAEPEWSPRHIDSARFRDPGTHHNPPMRWQQQSLVAPWAMLGAFRLDQAVLGQLGPAEPMPVQAARLPDGTALAGGRIYAGLEPQWPRVGDTRISYDVVRVGFVSVIGKQVAGGIVPFLSRGAEALLLISPGERTAAAMLQQAETENRQAASSLRIAGSGLLFGGLLLLMRPLRAFLTRRPRFAGAAGLAGWKIAGLVTLVVAPCMIAIGWLAARLPLV